MFSGTLGRRQFFVRSCLVGIAETVSLFICIAIQYEAASGPPGSGRYRLAAAALLISLFFSFKHVSFAIRRNRDAGGGDVVIGSYIIGMCMAIGFQTEALITHNADYPTSGIDYLSLLYLALGVIWLYLLLKPSAAIGVDASSRRSGLFEREPAGADSQMTQAMEQAIAGNEPISAPVRPQGFLGTARPAPAPRQRTEFGRRGLK